MGQTTGGLPWPEPTAPVRDGSVNIRSLAEATDTRYGSKRKHYIDKAQNTDVNGLLDIDVPTTATIYGCVVYERASDQNPNGPVILMRCYEINQASHKLRCRAYILNPFGVVSSGAVSFSAIVWSD